jgi:hypothetical protein
VLPPDTDSTVVLVFGEITVASWPLDVRGRLDLGLLDELARLQLAARRVGFGIRLRGIRPELSELLALTGLAEAVGAETGPGSDPDLPAV